MRGTLCLIALMTLASPACGADPTRYIDPRSGFAVAIPPDLVLRTGIRSQSDIAVGFDARSGQPAAATGHQAALCEVRFRNLPSNVTQDAINERVREAAVRMPAGDARVSEAGGIALVERELMPATAPGVRVLSASFVTPRGETILVCAAKEDDRDRLLPLYRALLAGLKPA